MRAATALSRSKFLLAALFTLGLVSAFSMPAYANCVTAVSGSASLVFTLSIFVLLAALVDLSLYIYKSRKKNSAALKKGVSFLPLLFAVALLVYTSFSANDGLEGLYPLESYAQHYGDNPAFLKQDHQQLMHRINADIVAIFAILWLLFISKSAAPRALTAPTLALTIAVCLFLGSMGTSAKYAYDKITQPCCVVRSSLFSDSSGCPKRKIPDCNPCRGGSAKDNLE